MCVLCISRIKAKETSVRKAYLIEWGKDLNRDFKIINGMGTLSKFRQGHFLKTLVIFFSVFNLPYVLVRG